MLGLFFLNPGIPADVNSTPPVTEGSVEVNRMIVLQLDVALEKTWCIPLFDPDTNILLFYFLELKMILSPCGSSFWGTGSV